jgi:hypothetical protein
MPQTLFIWQGDGYAKSLAEKAAQSTQSQQAQPLAPLRWHPVYTAHSYKL